MSSTALQLRYRGPSNKQGTITVDANIPGSLVSFVFEQELKIDAEKIQILTGYPPRPIDLELTLAQQGFKTGQPVTVVLNNSVGVVKQGHTDGKYVPPCDPRAHCVVRKVPGDDSCMFHAIAYVLNNKSRTMGPSYRSRIAEIVAAHPKKFTTAYLGKSNMEYCLWIQDPGTWGGAIELDILSFLTQTEIVAVDKESRHLHKFGGGEGYKTRAFVAYTGKHYDALALSSTLGGNGLEGDDQVLFNSEDEVAFKKMSLMQS